MGLMAVRKIIDAANTICGVTTDREQWLHEHRIQLQNAGTAEEAIEGELPMFVFIPLTGVVAINVDGAERKLDLATMSVVHE